MSRLSSVQTGGRDPDVESARIAATLRTAEDQLRARGWTGAQAFEALVAAIMAKLGDPVVADPAAAALVAELPVGGGHDLLGLAYERFFADLFKGQRGQYFTPRPLVTLLLDVIGPIEGHEVLDPTCGSGAFLVEAARRGARVQGIELDRRLAALATTHLRLAGIPGQVTVGDFFAAEPRLVDGIIANPPFSVEIRDRAVLDRYELGIGRDRALSDWLFVEAAQKWVRPGGWAALVLPWTVVHNPTTAGLRAMIDAAWHRVALCAFPEGVFRPFGGAAGRACLLWLRRRPDGDVGQWPSRWAMLSDPGYDVRSLHYRATTDAEVDELCRGRSGWTVVEPGLWTPRRASVPSVPSVPVAEVARLRDERRVPSRSQGPVGVVDLADADRRTGEIVHVVTTDSANVKGQKAVIREGDVLVSRLRPELGTVAVALPPMSEGLDLVGSTEWIVLRDTSHYVLHALRTPTWRASLGPTGGQTHPRITADEVMDTTIAWPGPELAARIHTVSERIHRERRALRLQLDALQRAVDAFAAGELDQAGLSAAIDALSR